MSGETASTRSTSALARSFESARTRTNIGFDIYNLFNSAPVLTYNQNFVPGGSWLAPLSVLTPRFAKIGAQISF